MARYIAGYVKWYKSQEYRHSRETTLVLMPMGEHSLEESAMDFFVELPHSEAFNTILVVTD